MARTPLSAPSGAGLGAGIGGLITDKAIRRDTFTSVKELVRKIDLFVTHYNKRCQPFAWTATADSIMAKLERLTSRISGTAH